MPQNNIHLTLAFLGSIEVQRLDELLAIGESIRASRFRMTLTRTGSWRRAQVVWIAPDDLPTPLAALATGLREQLSAANFQVDTKPFLPHITLVRKARCSGEVQIPYIELVWQVARFQLLQSDTRRTGPVYTTIGRWELG